MLRLTEIKLSLSHADDALRAALLHTLEIAPADLAAFTVFKRSFDARKAEIMQVYIVDVELASAAQEAALLPGTPATRTSSPRPTWPTTRLALRRLA